MLKSSRLQSVSSTALSWRTVVAVAAMALLVVGVAACGGGEPESAAPAGGGQTSSTAPSTGAGASANTPTPIPPTQTPVPAPEVQEEVITLQVVCINRTLRPCELIDSFYIPRVAERTNGQIAIEISSYPELGLAGPDTIRLVNDQTLEFAEIYSGYVGGDLPIIDVGNLWGLSPSNDAHLALTDAIEDDMIRILRDATGGEPIFRAYYPNQYVFSRDPLPDLDSYEDKNIRQHSTILGDLLSGLGAEGQFVAFADVYTALERGVLDAGITGGTPGYGQRWYEVTEYLYGPIVGSIGVTYVTVNGDKWRQISAENREILKEVGQEYEAENLRLLKEQWDPDGINLNVEEGMEYHDFPDDVKAKMRETALNTIIPNWVGRAGGPASEGVNIFNEKVGPIVGVVINPDGSASETSGSTSSDSSGESAMVAEPEFKIQLVCINRTGNPCTLIYSTEEEHGIDGFIERVKDRTNGRVIFQISSFPELGLAGPDSLRLIKDQTMELAEIYSGYIGGDLPIIDVANLWGLFQDTETNFAVIDATRGDLHRIIEEQSNGIVIMENYYESNYYFSSRPLNTLADFEGLKTRSHSTVLSDLLDGMGADAQFMAFADVYTGLERGVLDAAVSCGTCGSGVRWYEVTDYMVGPIVAIAVTWITMNKDVWESIPPDLQAIIREEGDRHQRTSREWVETVWAQEGIDENTEGGMEYVEFTPEIQEALYQAGRNNVLPKWVERTGGPNSEAVQIYNEKAAPIIGVRVGADGQAEDLN